MEAFFNYKYLHNINIKTIDLHQTREYPSIDNQEDSNLSSFRVTPRLSNPKEVFLWVNMQVKV